jgi:hypothetical protein
VDWKSFDPGEGFRLKLIYATKESPSVQLTGIIFGVKRFEDLTPIPKGEFSIRRPGTISLLIAMLFTVGATIPLTIGVFRRFRAGPPIPFGTACCDP